MKHLIITALLALFVVGCGDDAVEVVDTEVFVLDRYDMGYSDGHAEGRRMGYDVGYADGNYSYRWIMWKDCETDRLRSDGIGVTDTVHSDTNMVVVTRTVTYSLKVDTTCLRLVKCDIPKDTAPIYYGSGLGLEE